MCPTIDEQLSVMIRSQVWEFDETGRAILKNDASSLSSAMELEPRTESTSQLTSIRTMIALVEERWELYGIACDMMPDRLSSRVRFQGLRLCIGWSHYFASMTSFVVMAVRMMSPWLLVPLLISVKVLTSTLSLALAMRFRLQPHFTRSDVGRLYDDYAVSYGPFLHHNS